MMKIQANFPLKELNSFGLSVKAKYFTKLETVDQIKKLISEEVYQKEASMIIGGGSNVLFQNDFNGLIIQNRILGKTILEKSENSVLIRVGAGENWHEFVLWCIENNFSGIENLSLIPGCVGASPMQNIGAYGVEVKDVIENVHASNLSSGKSEVFANADCKFDYRTSIFKTSHKNKYLIHHVDFRLKLSPNFKLDYGAIKEELKNNSDPELSLKAVSQAVINIRQRKLPNPKEIGNAGSFFKNPIVGKSVVDDLRKLHQEIPAYALPDGSVKLAAGWLIEKAGWKGFSKGAMLVCIRNQALVLVNYGSASGKEISDLSDKIILDVQEKFGISLEREVNLIS